MIANYASQILIPPTGGQDIPLSAITASAAADFGVVGTWAVAVLLICIMGIGVPCGLVALVHYSIRPACSNTSLPVQVEETATKEVTTENVQQSSSDVLADLEADLLTESDLREILKLIPDQPNNKE